MNNKKKGNKNENEFASWMRENGFRAFKDGASGASTHKGDIVNGINLTIETKHVKRINLMEAWRQVARDSSIAHNSPLLAVRFDNMPKQQWLMVLHSEDWLELIKNQK